MASYIWLVNVVPTALLVLCEVAAMILILVAVRGAARGLAAIGIGLLILLALLQSGYSMMLPTMMAALGLDSGQLAAVSAVAYSLFALVGAAGLIMIAFGAGRAAVDGRTR